MAGEYRLVVVSVKASALWKIFEYLFSDFFTWFRPHILQSLHSSSGQRGEAEVEHDAEDRPGHADQTRGGEADWEEEEETGEGG